MYNDMLCRQISTILDINNNIRYDEKIETLLSEYGIDELHNALRIVHEDIYGKLIDKYLIHISNPSEYNLSSLSYYAYQLIILEGVLKKKNIIRESSTSFNEYFFNKYEICKDVLNKHYTHILGKIVDKQKEIKDVESLLQVAKENPSDYDKSEIYLAILNKRSWWKDDLRKYANGFEYLINQFVKKQKLDSVQICSQWEDLMDSQWTNLRIGNTEANTTTMLDKLLGISRFCKNTDYEKILQKNIGKQLECLDNIYDMLSHLEPKERINRMNKIVGPLLLKDIIFSGRYDLDVPIGSNNIEYELYKAAKIYIDYSFYQRLLKRSKNDLARWTNDAEKAVERGADTGAHFSGC